MPVFTALAIGALAVGTVAQVRQSKKAAAAQREANRVQTNAEGVQSRLQRRKLAREERRRRSLVLASASSSGALGSSGLVGAQGAIGSNFGQSFAQQEGQRRGAAGISAANQRAADAVSKGARIRSFTNLITSAHSLGKSADLF
jgi:hypothetical protein